MVGKRENKERARELREVEDEVLRVFLFLLLKCGSSDIPFYNNSFDMVFKLQI